ncbi:hypothetical protein MKW92_042045 [Papaver armeniacum]|nr:hypothetical protein MKW92_042045 [Papaver armeniacum]
MCGHDFLQRKIKQKILNILLFYIIARLSLIISILTPLSLLIFELILFEMGENGGKILERLVKGEIGDEELKKLIKIRFEKILQWGYKPTLQDQLTSNIDFIKSLKEMEMSGDLETMNSELPTAFLEAALGNTLKQSACYFEDESMTLDEAEIAAYELNCERANIEDGQTVLDIGCGQGGLVLHIAQKYKNCHVTGITNSTAQKEITFCRK